MLALVATSACSVFAVHGPASSAVPSGCTDSYVIPAIDTVPAAVGVVGGAAAILDEASPQDPARAIGVVMLLIGVVYAASAASGYYDVSRCQTASRPPPAPVQGCGGQGMPSCP